MEPRTGSKCLGINSAGHLQADTMRWSGLLASEFVEVNGGFRGEQTMRVEAVRSTGDGRKR